MAYCTKAVEYLRGNGVTNDEIDIFFIFVAHLKMVRKKPVIRCRLWTRLLRHRQTPYKKHERFDFYDDLKWYLWDVTKGEVVDDDHPSNAIYVDSESFVKSLVRHLDEAL